MPQVYRLLLKCIQLPPVYFVQVFGKIELNFCIEVWQDTGQRDSSVQSQEIENDLRSNDGGEDICLKTLAMQIVFVHHTTMVHGSKH